MKKTYIIIGDNSNFNDLFYTSSELAEKDAMNSLMKNDMDDEFIVYELKAIKKVRNGIIIEKI